MLWPGLLLAGPYSAGTGDPTKADAGIPGFTGPDGVGAARLDDGFGGFMNERNYVNPLFFGWADSVENYAPTSEVIPTWRTPELTLGPVTGDYTDIAALGDRAGAGTPGSITLYFAQPIRDLSGADFAIFENSFYSAFSTGGAGIGGLFGELAYVEVSTDGLTFVRFPSISLTPSAVGNFGTLDATNLHNLVGKHVNANGASWGTPFDLADVGLASIHYLRIVDIPGSGAYFDSANHPIYDAWPTTLSGGADIEAVGVISHVTTFDEWQDLRGLDGDDRGPTADPNRNSLPNLLEYAFSRLPDHNDSTSSPTQGEVHANRPEIIFTRDERATDLIYEVQARDSLTSGDWTTIARSTAGQACIGANGFTPTITETSASTIASVGVIRKVRVADVQTITAPARRFLRVKVTQVSPP
jgi:hypothetical protein